METNRYNGRQLEGYCRNEYTWTVHKHINGIVDVTITPCEMNRNDSRMLWNLLTSINDAKEIRHVNVRVYVVGDIMTAGTGNPEPLYKSSISHSCIRSFGQMYDALNGRDWDLLKDEERLDIIRKYDADCLHAVENPEEERLSIPSLSQNRGGV